MGELAEFVKKHLSFIISKSFSKICLYMQWNERRLKQMNFTDKHDIEERLEEKLVVPKHIMDKFWKPDIFVFGSKSGHIHQTTMENKMLRLMPFTGDFDYSLKMTTTIQCELHLEYFPFDKQICELIFQSCK